MWFTETPGKSDSGPWYHISDSSAEKMTFGRENMIMQVEQRLTVEAKAYATDCDMPMVWAGSCFLEMYGSSYKSLLTKITSLCCRHWRGRLFQTVVRPLALAQRFPRCQTFTTQHLVCEVNSELWWCVHCAGFMYVGLASLSIRLVHSDFLNASAFLNMLQRFLTCMRLFLTSHDALAFRKISRTRWTSASLPWAVAMCSGLRRKTPINWGRVYRKLAGRTQFFHTG